MNSVKLQSSKSKIQRNSKHQISNAEVGGVDSTQQVPVVKPVRTSEGFLMLPVKVSRTAIRAAIRADRDCR